MPKLEQFMRKGTQQLRMGYTTGSCAAAAASAATQMLLTQQSVVLAHLITPDGTALNLDIVQPQFSAEIASCAVQKDAGDDPDVTDGMLIFAKARKISAGTIIDGGIGIGRVTLPGLACEIGTAAINPVPRAMIMQQIEAACKKNAYTGGIHVEIFAPKGEEIAKKTFNKRLGIIGGISILGTTGIVRPMSESALIGSIHAEIDQKCALGTKTLLIVPGNYGRDFAQKEFGLDLDSGVMCSNFIGETLDYAVYKGFDKLLLLGHAGKLSKLAAGVMQTHSSVADGRCEVLTAHAAMQGITPQQAKALMQCATVDAAGDLLRQWGIAEPVWRSIGQKVLFSLQYRLQGKAKIAFAAFLKNGVVMRDGDWAAI